MADNRRYYWLKLHKDFFDSMRIRKLRTIAGGDTYTIIYLKMLLKSLESGGILMYEGVFETFAEELSIALGEDTENVKISIQYLESVGLLEVSKDGKEYMLPESVENTGSETQSAQRVRDFRERKTLHCNNDVTQVKRLSNVEKEKEKREEKDIENRERDIDALLFESSISDPLQEKVKEWIQYKAERRESYKPTGLKSLITQIGNKEQIYGAIKIMSLIDECMSNGWKGIIWDKLQQEKKEGPIDWSKV